MFKKKSDKNRKVPSSKKVPLVASSLMDYLYSKLRVSSNDDLLKSWQELHGTDPGDVYAAAIVTRMDYMHALNLELTGRLIPHAAIVWREPFELGETDDKSE